MRTSPKSIFVDLEASKTT